MSRSEDLLLLLTCGLALGCEPAVDPTDDGGPAGEEHEALEAAIEVCEPFATKTVECAEEEAQSEGDDDASWYGESISYVSVMGYCITQVGYSQNLGDDCVAAFGDYFACIAQVDCNELFGDVTVSSEDDDADDDQGDDEASEAPCAAQEAAIEASCDWGYDENESEGD